MPKDNSNKEKKERKNKVIIEFNENTEQFEILEKQEGEYVIVAIGVTEQDAWNGFFIQKSLDLDQKIHKKSITVDQIIEDVIIVKDIDGITRLIPALNIYGHPKNPVQTTQTALQYLLSQIHSLPNSSAILQEYDRIRRDTMEV